MGRKKTLERSINDYMVANQKYIPKIMDAMVAGAIKRRKVKCPYCSQSFQLAGGGDAKLQMYLIDRYFGKASQTVSLETKKPSVTGDDLVEVAAAIMQQEAKLLAAGEINAEYEVTEDGEDETGVVEDFTEGDVCGGGSALQPTDDGGGEGVGGAEFEVSSSEEE